MCPRLGGDCYCFADQPSENKMDQLGEEQCRVPCKGDSGFFCGGTTGLHLYIASGRIFSDLALTYNFELRNKYQLK